LASRRRPLVSASKVGMTGLNRRRPRQSGQTLRCRFAAVQASVAWEDEEVAQELAQLSKSSTQAGLRVGGARSASATRLLNWTGAPRASAACSEPLW